MTPGPRCGPDAIAKDLAIAGKNAAAELRLGEAVEGASAGRSSKLDYSASAKGDEQRRGAGPLHRHSAVPLAARSASKRRRCQSVEPSAVSISGNGDRSRSRRAGRRSRTRGAWRALPRRAAPARTDFAHGMFNVQLWRNEVMLRWSV